jgi:hypothetical protein
MSWDQTLPGALCDGALCDERLTVVVHIGLVVFCL